MKRILLVDDNDLVRRSLARVLSSTGVEVDTADDLTKAVLLMCVAADLSPYDAVISDMDLGNGHDAGGLAVLEVARRILPGARRVLVSGSTFEEGPVREAIDTGACDRFLPKPCRADDLLKALL